MAHKNTRKIFECLNNFDFKRVLKTMKKLKWKWASVPYPHIPKEVDLREQATELLLECLEHTEEKKEDWATGTGGFEANSYYDKDTGDIDFSLKFVVSDWDTF